MSDRFRSLSWQDQSDRSVAADFLEHVAEQGGGVMQEATGVWWLERIPTGVPEWYGVTLRTGEPKGSLQSTQQFRPPGTVQGKGERLTIHPRDSDIYLAAAFLLDRIEGVAWAADGTFLLDSPYAGGSTARARNFAEQFGLTVTLNDDPRLKPKWDLRRPRLGVTEPEPGVTAVLDRYNVPYRNTTAPQKSQFDTVIAGREGAAEAFRTAGGTVIVVDRAYNLRPSTAKLLLQQIYRGSARAV